MRKAQRNSSGGGHVFIFVRLGREVGRGSCEGDKLGNPQEASRAQQVSRHSDCN